MSADKQRILPGYNVSPVLYDSGEDELGAGRLDMISWRLFRECQTIRYDQDLQFNFMEPNVNLFNYPNFQLARQTDELNFIWENDSSDDWFHPVMPYWATCNPDMQSHMCYDEDGDAIRHSVGAIEQFVAGFKDNFWSENLPWGGNPL